MPNLALEDEKLDNEATDLLDNEDDPDDDLEFELDCARYYMNLCLHGYPLGDCDEPGCEGGYEEDEE